MNRSAILLLLPAGMLGACSDPEPPAPARPATSPATQERPPAEAPLVTPGARPGDAPAARTSLEFAPQEGWVQETPTSRMRKAQFVLPRQGGDERDAELVVFHFGPGQGGGVEENLARWAGQFELEDGGDPAALLRRSEREVGGMKVTEVALDGIYVAETPPGSGQRVRQLDSRLFGAILESGHGLYFVKVVGPRATVTHWEPSVRAYVDSAR